jgi:hypothetical protein
MTTVFASAAVSSALASAIYDAGGWSAVSILGAGLAGAGVLVWVVEQWWLRRRPNEDIRPSVTRPVGSLPARPVHPAGRSLSGSDPD